MSTWARIYAEIAASEDVANLRNQNPDAALLFVLGMPQAMPWGILPASPALFRAKVCPLFDLSLGQIEACLRLIIDSGLFQSYEDRRGKPLVYYTAWNRYQGAQQWSRVGPPMYDLPPGWMPPDGLGRALHQAARSRRGLTLEAIEARVLDSESKTRLRQLFDEHEVSLRQWGEEVRSKNQENDSNDSLSQTSSDDAKTEPSEQPEAPKPPARKRIDTAAVQADIDAARSTFPEDLLPQIDAFLDLCRAANKTGAIAITRERTETRALADAYAAVGDGPFRYGLEAALRKGAANVNYIKQAAKSYSPDVSRPSRTTAYEDPLEAERREYAEMDARLFGGGR